MQNIWKSLPKPIMCLAPMDGVTDSAFRRLLVGVGKPDLMMTEFVSVDQIFSGGVEVVNQALEYSEMERPLIAQIWGVSPDMFCSAGEMLVKFGFDGVDINMGCPSRNIISKGACSALVKDKPLAGRLIQGLKKGVAGELPVSVKIRIGFDKVVTEEWVEYLLKQGIDALTVHGRTTKELSKVPADWEEIAKAVAVRDRMGVDTVVIGNGDVGSLEEANEKVDKYGVDGVMIGRGIFHDPWLFNKNESILNKSIDEKLGLLIRHLDLWEEIWGDERDFNRLKRFFKIYATGFKGSAKLRDDLMRCESIGEVREMVANVV